ncbi:MAG TPA: phosphate ABC transporter permease PtsA [Rhodobiaceae bacterium]|nr:phosphate ABC transporter permease PtsA [Rhodobiaceae bacterium]
MTDQATQTAQSKHLKKRYRAEKRFKFFGLAAICSAAGILLVLLGGLTQMSIPAFTHHYVTLDIAIPETIIQAEQVTDLAAMRKVNWRGMVRKTLRNEFPEVTDRRGKRAVGNLLSGGAGDALRDKVLNDPTIIGSTVAVALPLSDDVDLLLKGLIDRSLPEENRVISDRELTFIDHLEAADRIDRRIAWFLFTSGDSREAEMAGLRSAAVGTLLTMLVTLLFSFPLGVMAAIYLEEIAPKNRLTDLIEVNINNLAAVPSIVFGLLGLAVFINFFHLPRSAPLVGGMVLALMTLPTIIIATRAALAAVPPSIREAALGVGASPIQVIFHHVLPLAMPGILTGTIIGLAQAAGETAPLLMIGMMAFIVDTPMWIDDKATVLPAQIYMWANNPERAFQAKTAAGIICLMVFLLLMNALAIYLRKKYEKRW